MELTEVPEWFGTAVLGAVLAVFGYVGKELAESFARLRAAERTRRARLVELLAFIRAGDVAWKVQCETRDRLVGLIQARDPTLTVEGPGYDRVLARAFATMSPAEHDLHSVVRAITVHTFQPLNAALLTWLAADTEFRVRPLGDTARAKLARYLADLEAHLLLWQAKFNAWIPDYPERALVYLADEERHGVPFPKGGARIVADLLQHHRVGA